MNSFERRNKIVDLINTQGSVLVMDLSNTFGISEVTIRADLPFALLLLSGCGSSDALPDLESQRLDLSVKASDKVNPDNQKKA
ncbi:DeoR family transcriptional regulator, partial [Salmonella enterica subsp. enterica serovar Virginia]|nr:DeoR family transcriptional regulator [Salmonella enterica subsp. enterica serovar Virginia]